MENRVKEGEVKYQMTAQIGDIYKWNSEKYTIVAMTAELPFDPRDFGMEPFGRCSCCWRGYWCEYIIGDDGLFLQTLYMRNQKDEYPDFNGITVSPVTYHEGTRLNCATGKSRKVLIEDYMGHRRYENVMLKIPYTGSIVGGRKFLDRYYIHMGFQRAWAYEELLEFVFLDGMLCDVVDHSGMARKLRMEIERNGMRPGRPINEGIVPFVDKGFSLDVKDKAWWIKPL